MQCGRRISPDLGADMSAPVPPSLERTLRRRPAGWVIELLALVERWLASARLPCAHLLYGGRSYLVRSATRRGQVILSAGDIRRAGSDE